MLESGVDKSKRSNVLAITGGVLCSIAITLVLILLFAVIIRFFNVPDAAIFPVNQLIKIISLFVGILLVVKKAKSKGLVNGLIVGLLYYAISYLIFGILQGGLTFGINNLLDIILTAIMGGIIGLISVHIIK
ncbi:MAG: TIGR04086 family membrane protein [Clostridiales bacterium]|nr:TIGR04086 family membrane protein [Clostridiales bacterium]